jgi:hypothetical protein
VYAREQESGLNDNCVCSVIVFAAYVANERKNLTVGDDGRGSGAIYIIWYVYKRSLSVQQYNNNNNNNNNI